MTDSDTDTEHTHRWTSRTDRVRATTGERITRDDEFTPTETELRCWPDRIEPLGDGSTETATVAQDSLTVLDGIGPATADDLHAAGYDAPADVRDADPEQLADDVDGIGAALADDLTAED